ncbi:MAG: SLC13 family permease [Peptococcaceae bacterium]|nr:SLC13 family permease [Peptococcaceae bacterium]
MSVAKNRGSLIKWGVCIVLAALCFLIPESELFTWNVKIFIAITVLGLAICAFELVPTIMISILMPALWIFFKAAPVDVVMSSWVSTLPLMIVGAFFMAASLEQCGLLRRVAFYLLCKVRGSYLGLLISIFLIGVLMNIITSGRGYLIMAALAFGLCVSMDGMQKKLGAGLAAAVLIGGCTAHVYTYQASGWGLLLQIAENTVGPLDITPLSIIIHNLPMFFVSFFLVWLASKMFKLDEPLGEVTWFKEQLTKMGPISREEKVNAIMLTILLIYVFTADFTGLDVNLGFAIIPWMVYLPFLNGAKAETVKKVDYTMVFFIISCASIGTVASSLGLGNALADVMQRFLGGSANPFIIVALIFVIVFALNFLMTPTAILALMMAPVLTMVTNMGFEPEAFAYAVSGCTEAIIFPYEYVPYLVVYGFGMMKMNDFIKYNIVRSLIVFVSFVFLLTPWWMLFGLM